MRPGTQSIVPREILPPKIVSRVCDLTGLTRIEARQRIAAENTGKSRVYLVEAGAPDISATQIRKQIPLGISIRREVPGSVREYIRKLHLYGGR
jgi:nicotinic acid mononucleotide adenylyltransferase